MNGNPATPKLTGGSGVDLTKEVKTSFILNCPNPECQRELDVTNLAFGTHIQCPDCDNITFRPEYNPPWWAKTRHYSLTIIGALVIGIITGVISIIIIDYIRSNGEAKTKINNVVKDSIN